MSETKGYKIVNQYGLHFLTFTTVGWVDLFSRKECRQIFIDSLKYCIKNKGLHVHAFVIMSNHVHLITSAEESTSGLSDLIRDIKGYTSRMLINWINTSFMESRRDWLKIVFEYHAKYNSNNKKFQIWQQDNHPKECIHPKFTMQKINYIHQNPVVAELVDNEEDYIYSSARNYLGIESNLLPITVIDFGVQEGYIAL